MDLGESKLFLNSTILTPNGAALNELVGTRIVIESDTIWKSPVTGTIYVTAISAGGNGGDGFYSSGVGVGAGGGGAAGNWVYRKAIDVMKGQEITCTVGLGNTVFGSYFTLNKGANGITPSSGTKGGNGGRGGYGSGTQGTGGGTSQMPLVEATVGGAGSGGGGGGQTGSGTQAHGAAGGPGVTMFGMQGCVGGNGGLGGYQDWGNYYYYNGGGGGAGVPLIFAKVFNGTLNASQGGNGGRWYNEVMYDGSPGADYGGGGGGGAVRSSLVSKGGAGGKGVIFIEWNIILKGV